ncbi:MAG TPA: hypothetical protein PKD37_03315 [Oligoflexia bacterium]|nr:hypothetical protein [Oligoflexia bacterium]HMP26998.1 hypothetical protein [Oligoflexia bacterium]
MQEIAKTAIEGGDKNFLSHTKAVGKTPQQILSETFLPPLDKDSQDTKNQPSSGTKPQQSSGGSQLEKAFRQFFRDASLFTFGSAIAFYGAPLLWGAVAAGASAGMFAFIGIGTAVGVGLVFKGGFGLVDGAFNLYKLVSNDVAPKFVESSKRLYNFVTAPVRWGWRLARLGWDLATGRRESLKDQQLSDTRKKIFEALKGSDYSISFLNKDGELEKTRVNLENFGKIVGTLLKRCLPDKKEVAEEKLKTLIRNIPALHGIFDQDPGNSKEVIIEMIIDEKFGVKLSREKADRIIDIIDQIDPKTLIEKDDLVAKKAKQIFEKLFGVISNDNLKEDIKRRKSVDLLNVINQDPPSFEEIYSLGKNRLLNLFEMIKKRYPDLRHAFAEIAVDESRRLGNQIRNDFALKYFDKCVAYLERPESEFALKLLKIKDIQDVVSDCDLKSWKNRSSKQELAALYFTSDPLKKLINLVDNTDRLRQGSNDDKISFLDESLDILSKNIKIKETDIIKTAIKEYLGLNQVQDKTEEKTSSSNT